MSQVANQIGDSKGTEVQEAKSMVEVFADDLLPFSRLKLDLHKANSRDAFRFCLRAGMEKLANQQAQVNTQPQPSPVGA